MEMYLAWYGGKTLIVINASGENEVEFERLWYRLASRRLIGAIETSVCSVCRDYRGR